MKFRLVAAMCAMLVCGFVGIAMIGCAELGKQLDNTSPQFAATATQPVDRIAQGADAAQQVAKNPTIQVVSQSVPWGPAVLNAIGTIGAVVLAIDQAAKKTSHANRADTAEAALEAVKAGIPPPVKA